MSVLTMLADVGKNLLNGITGGALGIGMGAINDKRQLEQQKELQALQIAGQKEMGEFNRLQQMQLWKDTNYKAQVQQLRQAGLNPALLYGMGGAGGATAAATPGQVAGATASQGGGGEFQTGMGMTTIAEQKELLKAQARLANVEADKKAGIDTKEGEQRISNLKAQEGLTKAQNRMQNLENEIKGETLEEQKTIVRYNLNKAYAEMNILLTDQTIKEETKDDEILKIKAEAIGAVLNNQLTESKIKVNTEQIKTWAAQVQQGWEKLTLDERHIKVQELLGQYNTSITKEGISAITSIIGDILNFKKGR